MTRTTSTRALCFPVSRLEFRLLKELARIRDTSVGQELRKILVPLVDRFDEEERTAPPPRLGILVDPDAR